MPNRPSGTRIDEQRTTDPVAASAVTRVTANPVDTYVAPDVNSDLGALVSGLSLLNPGLTKYLDRRTQEEGDSLAAEGARTRLTQDSTVATLPPESSPFFQQGYMKMHGQMAGQAAALDMMAGYEKQKNVPGFNPEQYIRSHIGADTQGMTDKDALAGYMAHATRQADAIRTDFARTQLDAVRAQTDGMVASEARFIASQMWDPADGRVAIDNLFAQGAALNKTRPEVAKTVAAALIEASRDGNPDILAMAYVKDKDGIALADRPEVATALAQARDHAVVVQKQRLREQQFPILAEQRMAFEVALATNPRAIDPVSFVRANTGPYAMFDTDEKAGAAVAKIIAAQRRDKEDGFIASLRADPRTARFVANDPKAMKMAEAEQDDILKRMNVSDPRSIKSTVDALVGHYERYGSTPKKLQSLLQNVDTSGALDEKGKAPKDFLLAANVYQSLAQSANPQLATHLTNDDTRLILKTFWDGINNGQPEGAAFAEAKRINTPEAKARAKAILDRRAEEQIDEEMKSKFTSWWPNALGGESARNIEDLQIGGAQLVRDYVAKGASLKVAMEQAKTDMKARYVFDGHTSYFEVAKNSPDREIMPKAVASWLADFKTAQGPTGSPSYKLKMLQGDRYIVLDQLGGIAGQVTVEELHRTYLEKSNATPETAAKASNLRAEIGSALTPSLTATTMTPERATEVYPEALKLFHLGQITPQEIRRIQRIAHQKVVSDTTAAVARWRHAQQVGDLNPGDPMVGPAPLELGRTLPAPGPTSLRAIDYARQYAQSEPGFALTIAAEGVALRAYPDPAKGAGMNIGVGYNMGSRTPEKIREDFRRAGIPADHIQDVMDGKREITPETALRLFKVTVPQYQNLAKAAIGDEAWAAATPQARAVMTDLAYATGNPAQFRQSIDAIRRQDWAGLSEKLTLTYVNQQGVRVPDNRRIALMRSLLSGNGMFSSVLDEAARLQPKG